MCIIGIVVPCLSWNEFHKQKILRFAYFDCGVLRSHVGPSVTCLKHDPPINKRLMNDIGAAPSLGSYHSSSSACTISTTGAERSASLSNRLQGIAAAAIPHKASFLIIWMWAADADILPMMMMKMRIVIRNDEDMVSFPVATTRV